jgi:cyclohexyl-isocyanide hydratase
MVLRIGMLLFPELTQLDLTGPYEFLHRIPDSETHLLWKDVNPIRAQGGLTMVPSTTLRECAALDIVFVPGGFGNVPLLNDDEVLSFLARQGKGARYVTSVCTGALVLGAAGLLDGYDAATHWAYMDLLPAFGARPVNRRVVVDRNRVTAGGVTSGIDFGLRLVAEICGEPLARGMQLGLEYNPDPPFQSGHPDVADPAIVARVRARYDAPRAAIKEAILRWRSR